MKLLGKKKEWMDKNRENKGDVKIAINNHTGKPDILTFKNRSFHTLILGPTGSGKTSQTIIPMINQDMQNNDVGITLIDPKWDLAEKVNAMAIHYNRDVVYFNPYLPNCPYFNPLIGNEEDVIKTIVIAFEMFGSNERNQYTKDQNERLLCNGLKVLKRLMGNNCTFVDFYNLITNQDGMGMEMVLNFSRIHGDNIEISKENISIADYFLNNYFYEDSVAYVETIDIRNVTKRIVSNKYLGKIFNPPSVQDSIDFNKHLNNGSVMVITTAQGILQDLGKFLGYCVMLQFQNAVFNRPYNENKRKAHSLYIDEFQVFAYPTFVNMISQGRMFDLYIHLATQNRNLIKNALREDGDRFLDIISTNVRNIIVYPGCNASDAKYYSEQFGALITNNNKKENLFTPSDFIYRPFGQITYSLVDKDGIQKSSVGKIQYIPNELNDELDRIVEEHRITDINKIKRV